MGFLLEQLDRAVERSQATGDNWCITLEARSDPDRWVQFTAGQINLQYPSVEEPTTRLESLDWPESLVINCWEPELYLTLDHGGPPFAPNLESFLERYAMEVLNTAASEDHWRTEFFQT